MPDFRSVTSDDADTLLALLESKRQTHERLHPLDAQTPEAFRENYAGKFRRALEKPDSTLSFVHESASRSIDAFLLSILVQAPPVYDPGGFACVDEAFTFPQGAESLQVPLLTALETSARAAGAAFCKITVSHGGDTALVASLTSRGYTIASEWYWGEIPIAPTAMAQKALSGVRTATVDDVPRILELGEQKRIQYQEFQPIMWRKSDLPRETFAPRVTGQIASPTMTALVHENESGAIDGYILTENGYVDDYAVPDPDHWESVGGALLCEASQRASAMNIVKFVVVCGHGDPPKRAALAALGLDLCLDWYVLNL